MSVGKALLLMAATLACGPHDGPTAFPSNAPRRIRPAGDVEVTTRTSGEDLDPDGYVLRVDGPWDYTAAPREMGNNETVVLRFLSAEGHTLSLDGLSPNCTGQELEYRPVAVVADRVVAVEFAIVCSSLSRDRPRAMSSPPAGSRNLVSEQSSTADPHGTGSASVATLVRR